MTTFKKDPDSTLDYSWDWSAWLTAISDDISAFSVEADAGVTVGSTTESNGVVTAFISGGTVGQKYRATCEVTTTGGRIDQRSIFLSIKEQ